VIWTLKVFIKLTVPEGHESRAIAVGNNWKSRNFDVLFQKRTVAGEGTVPSRWAAVDEPSWLDDTPDRGLRYPNKEQNRNGPLCRPEKKRKRSICFIIFFL